MYLLGQLGLFGSVFLKVESCCQCHTVMQENFKLKMKWVDQRKQNLGFKFYILISFTCWMKLGFLGQNMF